MKRTKWLLSALFACSLAAAQSKKISSVDEFSTRNFSVIKDKNFDVDGYSIFYNNDKIDKATSAYTVEFLDNNLTTLVKREYTADNYMRTIASASNNQAMAVVTMNGAKVNLVPFDKQANKGQIFEFTQDMYWFSMMLGQPDFNVLYPIENKGFLLSRIVKNENTGYAVNYCPTDGGKAWEYATDPNSGNWLVGSVIEANEKYVVIMEYSRAFMLSQLANVNAIVLDATTGKLLFKKEFVKKENPRTITNAMLKDNSVVLFGEYFKPKQNWVKNKSIGIYAEEFDLTGASLNETLVSWQTDVDPMLKETGNSELGYVMFEKFVSVENGDIFAIGERYRKNKKGLGPLGIIAGMPQGSLVIAEALVFHFDKDMKLKDIKKFDKGKSELPVMTSLASDKLNAYWGKSTGSFDYGFTQFDPKNNRFYTMFVDAERAGVKAKNVKYGVKAIIYDDGEFSEDRIELTSEYSADKKLLMLPAKVGYVTLIDYDKEKKEITFRLEKVNIK